MRCYTKHKQCARKCPKKCAKFVRKDKKRHKCHKCLKKHCGGCKKHVWKFYKHLHKLTSNADLVAVSGGKSIVASILNAWSFTVALVVMGAASLVMLAYTARV